MQETPASESLSHCFCRASLGWVPRPASEYNLQLALRAPL